MGISKAGHIALHPVEKAINKAIHFLQEAYGDDLETTYTRIIKNWGSNTQSQDVTSEAGHRTDQDSDPKINTNTLTDLSFHTNTTNQALQEVNDILLSIDKQIKTIESTAQNTSSNNTETQQTSIPSPQEKKQNEQSIQPSLETMLQDVASAHQRAKRAFAAIERRTQACNIFLLEIKELKIDENNIPLKLKAQWAGIKKMRAHIDGSIPDMTHNSSHNYNNIKAIETNLEEHKENIDRIATYQAILFSQNLINQKIYNALQEFLDRRKIKGSPEQITPDNIKTLLPNPKDQRRYNAIHNIYNEVNLAVQSTISQFSSKTTDNWKKTYATKLQKINLDQLNRYHPLVQGIRDLCNDLMTAMIDVEKFVASFFTGKSHSPHRKFSLFAPQGKPKEAIQKEIETVINTLNTKNP